MMSLIRSSASACFLLGCTLSTILFPLEKFLARRTEAGEHALPGFFTERDERTGFS
jgi:hypothetical protein